MNDIVIPINWSSVGDFLSTSFDMLNSIQFSGAGFTVSLWDIVIFSVIISGLGSLIYVMLGGGSD